MNLEAYLEANEKEHLQQLFNLLRFPSISALSAHKNDVLACAEFIKNHLANLGFENAELLPTKGNPVVYADWLHAPGQPTVLVYGHYDVQPVDPLPLWTTPPFEPEIRDGRIFARGATDDKGQTFLHFKALEALFQTEGKLPVNIKFCIEGEEEIGSAHLPDFLEKNAERFQADVLLISDTGMIAPGRPTICYGLRGLVAFELHVETAKRDLHSGEHGGGVPNAIHALAELIASFHDAEGRITVDGFHDQVTSVTAEELQAFRDLGHDDEAYRTSLGLPALHGEPGFSTLERLWVRPTLEVNGIYGGFQGEGTKTVIPREAHAKLTCRIVPDQTPEHIYQTIERHIEKHTPKGARVTLTRQDSGRPYVTPFHHPAIQWAAKAYEKAYGVEATFTRGGGSIPIVETFDRLLHIPVVLMGFGLPDENMHAPDENFALENFRLGTRTLAYYYQGLPDALK
ncbi:dipeptidase [Alicyclobacillus tolerans]|uniref:Acetylornithine deacetylase/Succinyl-diaminopimelate desuccinylase n=1 Tax=Alicyclobacillus tolerans TaxID=90970 RepID=A0A1M6WCZ4_9BACL|nr:dipeptidase [Alicyclobacillus montanus]SHK91529.1 Acetylornithine deacetylase/Succinyl-diaminopimelate desuccinylase [Alicyclobacillus montanus]